MLNSFSDGTSAEERANLCSGNPASGHSEAALLSKRKAEEGGKLGRAHSGKGRTGESARGEPVASHGAGAHRGRLALLFPGCFPETVQTAVGGGQFTGPQARIQTPFKRNNHNSCTRLLQWQPGGTNLPRAEGPDPHSQEEGTRTGMKGEATESRGEASWGGSINQRWRL